MNELEIELWTGQFALDSVEASRFVFDRSKHAHDELEARDMLMPWIDQFGCDSFCVPRINWNCRLCTIKSIAT